MTLRTSRIVAFITTTAVCLLAPARQLPAQEAPTAQNRPDQTNQLCTVAGTVVSLATGEPLRKARVVISSEDQQGKSSPQYTMTDGAGQFSITHIRPGRHSLLVYRDGYLPAQYGQTDPDQAGAILSLAPGQKMTDLIFRLQRMAVITGRVVNEDGDPMIRVSVEALQRIHTRGPAKWQPSGFAQTDDLGVYRIFDLSPGHYIVLATPNSPNEGMFVSYGDDSQQNSLQEAPSGYLPTYFPGTTDMARASVLDAKAGDEIPRVDFSFAPDAPAKTYRISGRATSTLANPMLMVMVVPRNPDTATPVDPMHLMARPDSKTGAFTIEGVPAGSYKVVASSIVYGGSGEKVHTATQDVDVANADVSSVSLVVSRGVDVSGRVAFEGQAAASARNLRVSIRGRDEDFAFGSRQDDYVEKDGSFTLTGVDDGTYTIRVYSKCDECYTKSATASGTNLLETGLVVQSGQAPGSIEIVYSSNTGKAAGTVTGADDLPAPGAYVMLVPASGVRDTEDDTKSATTDQYGRFEIRGVPPGHYKALAWAKMDSDSTDDPDFVKPFLAKADSLEVTTGATAALQLKAIPTSAIEPSN